jgi:transposase
MTLSGVGTDTAGALIVAAGDNPERLRNEATFATSAACPLSTRRPASSFATDSTAAGTARPTPPCGASWSPGWRQNARTQRYVERRCKEGLTKTEAMRCLKRYVPEKSSTTRSL